MPNRDVVVIGASAGGVEALQQLCSRLPSDLKAAVLIVMHTSPESGGMLAKVLSRSGPIPAQYPRDYEVIETGQIYIAPPDFHMIVESGVIRVVRGPRENRHRPAIDPTFRSAAAAYGSRVIGVILTGLLDDGTSGLMVIRARGGEAIVQDPRTALFPSMPTHALERVPDAHVLPLDAIAELIVELAAKPVEGETVASNEALASRETRITEVDMTELDNDHHPGKPSAFGCPECGGVLWEVDQAGLLRFRCRVGHAYTAEHLRVEQRQAVETALWAALRALEESASLLRRMADRALKAKQDRSSAMYEERFNTAQTNAKTLRDFLVQLTTPKEEREIEDSAEKAS